MKMFQRVGMLAAIGCVSIAIGIKPALAEDIDIFAPSGGVGNTPNVLFIIDNSTNWSAALSSVCYYKENGVVQDGMGGRPGPFPLDGGSLSKKFDLERCALYNVIDSMKVNADGSAIFNVGFMLFNEGPNYGAYVRKAFTPVSTANKVVLKLLLKSLDRSSDAGYSGGAYALSMYEAYRYFAGATAFQGQAGSKWDPSAFVGTTYAPPGALTGGNCVNGYIIFIANGAPGDKNDSEALALLASTGGNTTKIAPAPAYPFDLQDGNNWADEFARFMSQTDVSSATGVQSIKTFAIAVTGASSDKNYPKFMDSVGINGGTSVMSRMN